VAPGGSDGGDGSEKRPFATIERAVEEADGGSVIHVMPGIYDGCTYISKSGLNTDPITIVGEGKSGNEGRPQAKLTCTGDRSEKYIIDFDGHSNYRIVNLDIGGVEGKYVCGVFLTQNCKNISISGNYIHDIRVEERYLVSPEVDGRKAGEANAILCLGEGKKEKSAIEYITICDNEICGNVTNWNEAVSVAGNAQYINIYGNVVHDNTNIGIDFNGNTGYCRNPRLDRPRNCEAHHNLVYNCHCDYAECAGIYADGASDIKLYDNEVYGCDYGMEVGAEIRKKRFPVQNVTVSGNNIHDNIYAGIVIGGYDEKTTGLVRGSLVEGNFLSDNTGAGICINRCTDIVFRDNRISSDRVTPPVSGDMDEKYTNGLKFEGNLYETDTDPESIRFRLFGRDVTGVSAFNALTGGSDRAG
jgi:parallel beta-helix repeat protein